MKQFIKRVFRVVYSHTFPYLGQPKIENYAYVQNTEMVTIPQCIALPLIGIVSSGYSKHKRITLLLEGQEIEFLVAPDKEIGANGPYLVSYQKNRNPNKKIKALELRNKHPGYAW